MEALLQECARKRNKTAPDERAMERNRTAPDEQPLVCWNNREVGTSEMCLCDCAHHRLGTLRTGHEAAQEPESAAVDLRCYCMQCGPEDVNSQTRRCTVRQTRIGAQIDRFMRVGPCVDATAPVNIAELGSGDLVPNEPFFCGDCREANHCRQRRLRRLRVQEAWLRARQERQSQGHELRGSDVHIA